MSLPRITTTGVLLAALPAAAYVPPLAGLAGLVIILSTLITVETTRYTPLRHVLRGQ